MSKVNPTKAISIGSYHFHPRWTKNYGDSEEKRIEEFEDVMKSGYFNSIIVEIGYLNNDEFWRVISENDATVWLNCFDSFDSEVESIESWLLKRSEAIDVLKQNEERWERFLGFHFDEPVWRGQSNADFLTMTKTLYEKYSKRIYPVFATGEFSRSEGNSQQIKLDAKNMKKVRVDALKYVTDIGFDSYSVDVRDGASNGDYIKKNQEEFPEMVDGKSYYKVLAKKLASLAGHDVNIWLYPCAYTTSLWGGLNGATRADEDYCLAHLEFFRELLLEQEFQGGINLYTYTQFRDNNELGLQSHLVVKDENGNQKLLPDIEKWEKYSKRLSEICEEFKNTEAKLAVYKVED